MRRKSWKNKKECLTDIFGFLFICSFTVVLGACGSPDAPDAPDATDATEPTAVNCSQAIEEGCSLTGANHGDSDVTGTCATGYTGSTCSFNCNDGKWEPVSNSCDLGRICPDTTTSNINGCSLTGANHGDSDVAGTCATGYTGNCSFNCNDGEWQSKVECSPDADNDGVADTNDLCANSSFTSTSSNDRDEDGCQNTEDVDDDGDGLIEISTPAMLDNMRYNLRGTSYDDEEEDNTNVDPNADEGDKTGCGGRGGIRECNGYELDNDITLMENWPVILGNFHGTFDGNDFSISGFSISSVNANVGFFANVSGLICNIHLTGSATVTSTNGTNESTVGSLIGLLNSGGRVFSSSASISVSNTASSGNRKRVGGLVGFNDGGTIRNSYATEDVGGGAGERNRVGGLVGFNDGGTIRNSYATGNVTGSTGITDTVGGLVGQNDGNNSIRDSYATGNVDGGAGNNDRVGGLVGFNAGTIRNSYATGNIDGGTGNSDRGGGLVAQNDGIGTAINSYWNDNAIILNVGATSTIGTSRMESYLQAGTNIAPNSMDSCQAAGGTFSSSVCTDGHYNGWSTNNWVFEATKFPTLRSYIKNADDEQDEGEILCGQDRDNNGDGTIDWVAPPLENQCP